MPNSTSLEGYKRTHRISNMSSKFDTESVCLMGWVHSHREHKNVVFVDLRDITGRVQVVFDPDFDPSPVIAAKDLKNEFVIAIRGKVRKRPEGMINTKLSTGDVEVMVSELKILNRCEVLPFQIHEEADASEALKLQYRYIDLRKPEVNQNILAKVKLIQALRHALERRDFLDIETPLLYKSTPEGAREFLVPSRIHPEHFYALPQSPQLFKQTLMISGFDRYYQVVKCFRDEDLRADRQPEFQQLDCEMSFVEQEDVLNNFEQVVSEAVEQFMGHKIPSPIRRMPYEEAIRDYGSDKPDVRFDLKLQNITEALGSCEFKVFQNAIDSGGIVNCLVVKQAAETFSRKDIDALTEVARQNGAKGLAWAKIKAGTGAQSWQSPIAKFLSDDIVAQIESTAGLETGDFVCFGAGAYEPTQLALGAVRNAVAKRLNLADPKDLSFLWIIDFPLVEKDEENERWLARHHPFTSPVPEDFDKLDSDIGNVRAAAYDLVLNGNEIAGGSVRIHDPELQARQFAALGLSKEETQEKFGFLLEALSLGAPPHGGIAFGLDRFAMVLRGLDSIKEVIPFPKTNKGTCLMTQSPSKVSLSQLHDLHVAPHNKQETK
jgi:aspartyl-tRNA synthetase